MFLAPLGDIAVLSLGGLPKPVKHVFPDVDGVEEVADGARHGLDGVIIALITEHNELFTGLAVVLMCHTRACIDRRGTGDVGTGQDGGPLVVVAKAKVESSCTLKAGILEGGDGETKSGGEGLSRVRDIAKKGVEREKLGADSDRTSDYQLDKGHFDGGEASLSKDLLDDCYSLNVSTAES